MYFSTIQLSQKHENLNNFILSLFIIIVKYLYLKLKSFIFFNFKVAIVKNNYKSI